MFRLRDRMLSLIRNPIPGQDGLNAAPTFEIGGRRAVSGERLDDFVAFSEESPAFRPSACTARGRPRTTAPRSRTSPAPTCSMRCSTPGSRVAEEAGSGRRPRATLLSRDVFGDPRLGPIARNIIKMWYVGTWYELPSAWTDAYGARQSNTMFTVSPAAYTEGLAVAGDRRQPAGREGPGYGSWAQPPRIPAVDGPATTTTDQEVSDYERARPLRSRARCGSG